MSWRAKKAIKYTKGDNMPRTEREKTEDLIRAKQQDDWLDRIGINRTLESPEEKRERLDAEKKAKAIKSHLGS
jgi:hypothetical protein